MRKGREIKRLKPANPLSRPRKSEDIRKYCYLCSNLAINPTREHLIPKSIYYPNSIMEPLILTACRTCNQLKKLDDEYASLLIQASSNSKEGFEAFRKSISIIEKKYRETGVLVDSTTEGVGLVMGLKKNTRDLDYIKENGVVKKFGGGQFDIDVPRINRFFVNIGKGLMVNNTSQIYDWDKFKIGVIFDQIEFSQLGRKVYDTFLAVLRGRQYAEQWEDALFVAGSTTSAPHRSVRGIHAITVFNSFAGIVAFMQEDFVKELLNKET